MLIQMTDFIKPGTSVPLEEDEASATLRYYMAALGTIAFDAGGELRVPKQHLIDYLETHKDEGLSAVFEDGDLVIRIISKPETIH